MQWVILHGNTCKKRRLGEICYGERSLKPRARPINITVLFLCKYCIVIMCFISFVSVWLCWGAPTYRIHHHIVLNSTFYLIDVGNFDFCFGFGVLCSVRVFFEWFVYLNTNEYNRVINGGAIGYIRFRIG